MAARKKPSAATPGAGHEPDRHGMALYAAPPDAFVAARDALAATLAPAAAANVRRLRRPTEAAWLLDAVARERPEAIAALRAAAEGMRRAQARALQGDPSGWRAATASFHGAVAGAMAAAREVAASAGRPAGPATLAGAERGLRAIPTAAPAVLDALEHGVLARPPEPSGLDPFAGVARLPARAATPPAARRAASRSAASGSAPHREPQRARSALEAERLVRERRRADAEAWRAERVREAAEARVRNAERAVDAARERLDAAQRRAASARAALARIPRPSSDAPPGPLRHGV